MRARIIIRYVGVSLVLVAIMMAISGLVAINNGYDDSTTPLLFSSLVTFILGIYPMLFVRADANISSKEGIAIVVLSWLACCLSGMIPYICYGGEFTLMDAFFESVSGFTTTGASILNDIEALPSGLLFWRASTAWVGGLGIVSIFSLVIPRNMDRRSVLSSAELSEITKSQSSKRGKSFIGTMLTVYILLTVVCTLSLKMTGMRWFDAATNAMSTCSTCGFCVKNASIAAYDSLPVELITVLFMTISGISFMQISTFALSRGNGRRRLSAATRAFLMFLIISTLVISVNITVTGDVNFLQSLRLAVFQVSSITTTTGFATADTNVWPPLSIILLLVASMVCGCSGSTSGGMKMDRIVVLSSYMMDWFRKGAHPHRMTGARIDGKTIDDETASEAMKFVLTYVGLLVVGTVINTSFGLDIESGASASIACLGNVGPGFGSVGSMSNYADFPDILKFTSSLLMIAGRLEIIPLISFISLITEKKTVSNTHRDRIGRPNEKNTKFVRRHEAMI